MSCHISAVAFGSPAALEMVAYATATRSEWAGACAQAATVNAAAIVVAKIVVECISASPSLWLSSIVPGRENSERPGQVSTLYFARGEGLAIDHTREKVDIAP